MFGITVRGGFYISGSEMDADHLKDTIFGWLGWKDTILQNMSVWRIWFGKPL